MSAAQILCVIAAAVAGAGISSFLACVPGLHVYNVMGLAAIAAHVLTARGHAVTPEIVVPLAAGMIVGYSMLNTLPSVFLAAPDESALFTVLPGQKYLMQGRGHEAVVVTSAGGLAALLVLVPLLGLAGARFLPVAKGVFQPHYHWILWCVICFMLLSEWPKEGRLGQSGWRRFAEAWKSLAAGLLTFVLSGLLGFVLIYRSPVAVEVAFQSLMPAFVGLFTIPWLLLNIVSRVTAPEQKFTVSSELDAAVVMKGTLAGALGGGFAAFFPAITGGVGGMLAGHATAWRDDRVFLVSQGASKVVYYVGSFLLFFVPYLHMTRGSGAWMLRGLYEPKTYADFHMALAAVALAGCVSFLLISPLTKGTAGVIRRFGYRRISLLALLLAVGLVVGLTGPAGLLVMLTATGIGLLPVLHGSRRMNCLGIILLPIACNMSGIGPAVAGALGLM